MVPPTEPATFPLSAIVGQQHLKRALLIAASSADIVGLLVRGERDAGKRTAVTALAVILPVINAPEGCIVHCSPSLGQCCPLCTARAPLKIVHVRAPFIEVPISVTEENLMGCMVDGEPYPGLLARANRGYLFIDRVNLFSESLVQKIFDVQRAGELFIEGDRWPSKFVLLATMNDEEGAISRGLMSRFSLCTNVKALTDIEERLEVVKRVESFRISPDDFIRHYTREDDTLRSRVLNARRLLPRTEMPLEVYRRMERLCKPLGKMALDRLSAAAKGNAALNERIWVTTEDLNDAAPLVIEHMKE